MDYIYRKEAMTKTPLTQLALVHDDVPLYYVMMKRRDIEQMTTHMPQLLARYEKQLSQQVSRFQSASALRSTFLETEKMLSQLAQTNAAYVATPTFDTALALYDDMMQHIEFAAKHIPYIYDANAWTLGKHGVNEASIQTLFDALYDIDVDVYPANVTADQLGFDDEYVTFYMMSTDVLYDFPTMLKTHDLPNFTLNIAKYFKKDATRGKTKSAVVEHAFMRIIRGLALAPVDDALWLFRPNPAYRVVLSDVKLPIVTERKRYVVRLLQQATTIPHKAMHYEDGRFTRAMEAVDVSAEVLTNTLQAQPFIVQQFQQTNSAQFDRAHIPVDLRVIDDIDAFVAEVTAELPETERAFYTLLTSHFKEEVSKLCKTL